MTLEAVSAVAGLAISSATAAGVLIRGWRRRIQDAARKPFLTGAAAIEEAETALRLKDQRLAQLTASEAESREKLAQAEGKLRAQGQQLTELQASMYRLESENRELLSRAETAESREREARVRIGTLEDQVADLNRKLSLGGPGF
jgi:uncharacterized protein HemX